MGRHSVDKPLTLSLQQQGYSLIEVTFGALLLTLVSLAALSSLMMFKKMSLTVSVNSDSQSQRSTAILSLEKALEQTLTGEVWVNPDVFAQAGVSWINLAQKQQAIVVAQGYKLVGATSADPSDDGVVSAASEPYDIVVLIQRDRSFPSLLLESATSNPAHLFSNTETQPTFTFIGDASGLAPGQLLATTTAIGSQFLRFDSVTGNSLTASSLGTYDMGPVTGVPMPARYLLDGTPLFRVVLTLIGVDHASQKLQVVRIPPGSGGYELQIEVGVTQSLQVLPDETVPFYSLRPKLNSKYLQIIDERPGLDGNMKLNTTVVNL